MLRIAVCDDELSIIESLKNLINELCPKQYEYCIDSFVSGKVLLLNYNKYGKYDIIFMDIEIGDCNGIDVIRAIRKIDPDVMVIFVTKYSYYVTNAFRVGAFQYLVKPINAIDFKKDFYRAISCYKNMHKVYDYKNNGKNYTVNCHDIQALEIYNKKILLYINGQKIIEDQRNTIKMKAMQLRPYGFIQCHKSFIVNISKISVIMKESLYLKDNIEIPIGRNYKKELLTVFNKFLARYKI